MSAIDDREVAATFQGKHILVTGASGFLATSLLRVLGSVDCRITCLSHRPMTEVRESKVVASKVAERFENGPDPMTFSKCSARVDCQTGSLDNRETWEHAVTGVDYVFHFAAQTSVRKAEENPEADFRNNVLPLLLLLESCRSQFCHPSILFAGSVTQAGVPSEELVDESLPDDPVSVYELHKLMAEKYLSFYSRQGVVSGVTLRLPNIYGPGPESSSADRGILNRMMKRAIAGEALTVYGNGKYLRDYLYIEDAVRAFLLAARNITAFSGQHFVTGTGRAYSIVDAFKMVAEKAKMKIGREVSVMHVDPPSPLHPVEKRSFVVDSSKFYEATGWTSSVSLGEGIDRTLDCLL